MKRVMLSAAMLLISAAIISAQSPRGKVQSKPVRETAASIQKALLGQLASDGEITGKCTERFQNASGGISLKAVDLNGDGKPEYLLRLSDDMQSKCFGETKATVWCYGKAATGEYVRLLSADTTDRTIDDFSAKKTVHRGYADLELDMTQGLFLESVVYRFDGARYREAKRETARVP